MPKAADKGTALADDLLEFLVQVAKIKDARKLGRVVEEIEHAESARPRPPRRDS